MKQQQPVPRGWAGRGCTLSATPLAWLTVVSTRSTVPPPWRHAPALALPGVRVRPHVSFSVRPDV